MSVFYNAYFFISQLAYAKTKVTYELKLNVVKSSSL